MKTKGLILAALILLASAAALTGAGSKSSGQSAVGDIWRAVDESSIVSRGKRLIVPAAYSTVRLDGRALARTLAAAPREFTVPLRQSPAVVGLPMPDGRLARFRVEESPIMEPGLAARHPNFKTYRAQGVDDPTATARFGITPAGFHAIILSAGDTVYVDPYAQGDSVNHISYYKRDLRGDRRFECKFNDFNPSASEAGTGDGDGFQALVAPNAGTLRTYRLALAVTGEYTMYFSELLDGDEVKKDKAFAAMTATMNRVNGIYEREFSVRMVFINDERNIIYTNPATDPYPNDPLGLTLIDINQVVLDTPKPAGPVGEGNYDIGHLMSTGFGGVAYLRSVCNRGDPAVPADGTNAGGYTGLNTPEGDGFDIDFVAHEMGHQFGGNHTFNGQTGSCSGTNRAAAAAYEPGSATTIMGYAGICGVQDLQPHSDADFHVKSLEEVTAFIKNAGTGGNCATRTAVENAAPTADAGPDYTIPKNTPFTLTAAATDPDAGDVLTYDWEEYDLGPASTPGNDHDAVSARPIFRSYLPTTNPSRTFPSLRYVLDNANTPPASYDCGRPDDIIDGPQPCLTGEVLPQIQRTMRFQVTTRDNRAAGGGVDSDEMQVNVREDAGPFLVTAPNTGVAWAGNTSQTVTWDVANTTAAPINAALVKISLSADGGQTFPYVLAASTANDGSEVVTVPNAPTGAARIKVEAVGNIFFDISNRNFSITLDETACVTNHALAANGATATASSTYPDRDYAASGAIDGDRTGADWAAGGGWNDATYGLWPDWLQVTFDGPKTLNLIRVVTLQNDFQSPAEPTPAMTGDLYGLLDYEVQYMDADGGWVTVPGGNITGNNLVMRGFVFPDITTQSIRVLVHKAREDFSRVVEVEAYGCPVQ
ncbi:MAG: M12 family metallo-peptidase [Acidobacteriota bacterium]|nr:M12 family metallo-peptidase [Acidobacteriota bacterium]